MRFSFRMLGSLIFTGAIFFSGCSTPAAIPDRVGTVAPSDIATNVFETDQLHRRPRPLIQKRPQYPVLLRRAGVSGGAVIDIIVDAHGQVRNAHVVQASHPAFAEEALACVSAWTFVPGSKDGLDVNTHLQIPIMFTLNNDRP